MGSGCGLFEFLTYNLPRKAEVTKIVVSVVVVVVVVVVTIIIIIIIIITIIILALTKSCSNKSLVLKATSHKAWTLSNQRGLLRLGWVHCVWNLSVWCSFEMEEKVEHMEKIRYVYRVLVGRCWWNICLGYMGIDMRIILKWITVSIIFKLFEIYEISYKNLLWVMQLLEQEMFMLLTSSGHVVVRVICKIKVVVFDMILWGE